MPVILAVVACCAVPLLLGGYLAFNDRVRRFIALARKREGGTAGLAEAPAIQVEQDR